MYDEHPMAGRNGSKQELVEIYNTDKIEKLIKINVKYKTILDLHNPYKPLTHSFIALHNKLMWFTILTSYYCFIGRLSKGS